MAFCTINVLQRNFIMPKAIIPIGIEGCYTFSLDDAGTTKSMVDISYLRKSARDRIVPWKFPSIGTPQGGSFSPKGMLPILTLQFGRYDILLQNVAVIH